MAATNTATTTFTTTITTTTTTTTIATTITAETQGVSHGDPTVLYSVQVLQTIVYYTYIGIVFNHFGTVAKTILSLPYDPG